MSEANPTIDVREGEALDVAAVDALLKAHIEGLTGAPRVRQFRAGHSNLTYSLEYPDRALVLRRPPFGTRPKSSHDMGREYRIINALKPVFPAVPTTYLHVADPALLGCEFYVMEKVPGRVLGRTMPASWGLGEQGVRALCTRFWDTLIELHGVDYAAIGLADYGRPEGYVERQIRGWNGRYEKALTPDVEDFADVRAWLVDKLPEAENPAAILHGDYRLDNILFDLEDPLRIRAVLDWEISALGDPLMDLGNTLAYWVEATDPPALQALAMQPSAAPGMLTRAEVLDRYAERTGIDVSGFDFYRVYGYFRIAVILQQIYYRYYHGQTSNPDFAGFGNAVQVFGRHCRSLIEGSPL